LKASAPTGWLSGCDRDGEALALAAVRLKEFAGRYELRLENFADMAGWIEAGSCDGVLLDLGVSSAQLDLAGRGFSFQQDGPLDMRFDTRQPLTAAQLVNESDADELARIFRELGDEREARRIARAIEHDRKLRRFETTRQLAALIERLVPPHGKKTHPATRVFLALRMAVNDELGSLERGLAAAMNILKQNGRLVVITFHSVEDRWVKQFGRAVTRDYTLPDGSADVPELRRPCAPQMRWVNRKAIQPGATETAANPRARSAQLRVLEKL
jgi:16S rRNA (cytosine1402-N4)-methyltransferase